MFFEWKPGRENDPLRWYAARFRLTSQIARCFGIVLEQPQHAALDPCQQPHPHVENGRRDLIIVVETAEDKASIGKVELTARGCLLGDAALAVIGLIRVGKANDLLAVESVLVFGNDPRIR